MEIKSHYTTTELAALGLNGQPGTRQAWEYKVKTEGWNFVEAVGRGGTRKEYCPSPEIMVLIQAKCLESSKFAVVEQPSNAIVPTKTENLAKWQRDCAEARLAIVREIQKSSHLAGKTHAIEKLVKDASMGELPTPLLSLLNTANAKKGESRALSRRSLFGWCAAVELAEANKTSSINALAPKSRDVAIPGWAALLLKCWGKPQKPNLPDVLTEMQSMLPPDMAMPSYHQAYRFLQGRVGAVEREKGRMGPRALKNIKGFIRRDTTMLLPTDVYVADGHCFDAEVAHPFHGGAFRPEITMFMDAATRLAVGWSVDLAESGWAVLDALRSSACKHGIPAMLYVDNGSGYANELMKARGTGLMARLGTEMTHSLPYNSQAKGVIERPHKSLWVKAAKKLPTYIGKDMDAEAKQKVFKIVRADLKKTGTSKYLMAWKDFLSFCEDVVSEYNQQPHSSLPKVRDAVTLKTAHLSPLQAWEKAVKNGFIPTLVMDGEQEDLFRPYAERKVLRCEIQLFNNIYFSKALEQYHDETVLVGYDIQDPETVLVRNSDGVLIAKAEWNANKRAYFPESVVNQARQKRADGRMKRLQAKANEVALEANPNLVLEHIESKTVIPFKFNAETSLQALAALEQPAAHEGSASTFVIPEPEKPTREVLTNEEKVQKWLRLDAAKKEGVQLVQRDEDFWELFPESSIGRMLLREREEHLRALLAQGTQR